MSEPISQQAVDELYDYVNIGFGHMRCRYAPFLVTHAESELYAHQLRQTARRLLVFRGLSQDKKLLKALDALRGTALFRKFMIDNALLFNALIDQYEAIKEL